MSYADTVFKSTCRTILEYGTSTEGEAVRPHWEDGSDAYTIKKFGIVNKYDLRTEFPAITLRKTAIKSAFDEILWIYQKKSNNIHDLNSHIWDQWADENGTIGKAYGYQIGEKYLHHYINLTDFKSLEELPAYPSVSISAAARPGKSAVYMDQIDSVLWDLRHSPFSRRIMTNIYNFKELNEMHLYPCAYSCTFNVTREAGEDNLTLNMILNQRSQDMLAAGNWNPVQYALLLIMIAQSVNMTPGVLLHVIADCHIYDRHVKIIKELLTREEYPAPKVWLNPEVKDFYKFTVDDLHVEDYKTGEQIKNIPIAV